MKTKKILTVVIILLMCVTIITVSIFLASQDNNNDSSELQPNVIEKPLYGISGYTPANFPSSNLTEITNYWSDIKDHSQLYGVHVDWKDTKILDTASKRVDSDIELVLGIQNPAEWTSSKSQYIEKATEILSKNKKVKYLAIGNEVDTLYEKYPNDFDNFVSFYNEAYVALKQKFPDVKIYTVFQFEHLKGDGYLLGKKDERSDLFFLISKFNVLDLIGLTTYPYFDYQNPEQVPGDYFGILKNYSSSKIAITETGWPARTNFGGKLESLNSQGFTGSEEEQVTYLNWLLAFKDKKDQFEYINWIFVNDAVAWSNGAPSTQFELFDSIALKNHEGVEKLVWKKWVEVVK